MVVRPARLEDVEAIAALLARIAREEDLLGLDPRYISVSRLGQLLTGEDGLPAQWVAVLPSREVVGHAFLLVAAEPPLAHTATLAVAVASEHRRQGAGTALLRAAEESARARGLVRLNASTVAANTAARALFRKAGFAEEGVRRAQIRLGGCLHDEILLGKLLQVTLNTR